MHEMESIVDAAEVNEGPVEGVLAVRAVVDGDDYVPALPPLSGLPLLCGSGDRARQLYLRPAVNLVFLQRLHSQANPLSVSPPRRVSLSFL